MIIEDLKRRDLERVKREIIDWERDWEKEREILKEREREIIDWERVSS